jgi:predicted xylose isomerase-like sugar epimerase
MTESEMEAMIEKAAVAGARTALREVGLSDDDANSDVRELRNLLDSFRSAKRTVGKTIIQGLTTLFLAALLAGAWFNISDKQ